MLLNRRYVRIVAFAALAAALAAVGVAAPRGFPPATLVEDWIADIRLASLTPVEPQHDDIVILAIDEATLATMGYRSPVDREDLAGWVSTLEAKGVRAIGIDILFDQRTEPHKDDMLRAALAAAKIPVVVGWANETLNLTPDQLAFQRQYLDGLTAGHVHIGKDAFGTTRWIPGPAPDRSEASEAVRLSLVATIAQALGVATPPGRFEIAYRGPAPERKPAFAPYPAHATGFLRPDWLADRIVLIGAVRPLDDRHRTPFSAVPADESDMPGVMIHAQALAQLLDRRVARRSEIGLETSIAVVVVLIGMALAFWGGPASVRIGLLTAATAALWVGGFALYQRGGPLIPLVMPTLVMGAAYGITSAAVGAKLRKEKRQIRRAFRHYVAPAVISHLEADPERLKLGGEWREVTYIFTDIAGFTTLSEGMDPERLVPMLNAYLDGMCQILIEHECTLDKFIGDAVVAVLGAPDDQPDHAERGVRCALDLDAFAQAFSDGKKAEGIAFGATRMRPHRARGGRQHWRREAFRLHCHRRYREHRGAPRGGKQVPGNACLHQRFDRGTVRRRGPTADWGAGVEGKNRGGGGVRAARPGARGGAGHVRVSPGVRKTGARRSIYQ